MRTITRRNGQRLDLNVWNRIDGTFYPPGWLQVGDRGIESAEVEDFPDPAFYTWTENADGSLNITAIPQAVIDAAFNAGKNAQIDAIERQTLVSRPVREFMLTLFKAQAAAAGVTEANLLDPQHPAYSPAYKKVWDCNEDIKALRAQRR